MAYVVIGIGVGFLMYSYINLRFNEDPWASSKLFFWIGLILVLAGGTLLIK
ncbi:MAG TPA: hypothetical protein VE868_10265 [Balneolaceae bacterium]|nr:hypothetical protein [Balneolaceae bacterium]